FQKSYPLLPDVFAVQQYDGMRALDEALKKLGGDTSDKDKVVKALEDVSFKSPRGDLTFDKSTHNPIQDIYIREVKTQNGQTENTISDKIAKATDPGKYLASRSEPRARISTGAERSLVRRLAFHSRLWPLARVRDDGCRQPRARRVLHARGVRRALRRPVHWFVLARDARGAACARRARLRARAAAPAAPPRAAPRPGPPDDRCLARDRRRHRTGLGTRSALARGARRARRVGRADRRCLSGLSPVRDGVRRRARRRDGGGVPQDAHRDAHPRRCPGR